MSDDRRPPIPQQHTPLGTTPGLRPRNEVPLPPGLRPVPRTDVPDTPEHGRAPSTPVAQRAGRFSGLFRPHRSPRQVVAAVSSAVLVTFSVVLLGWGLWETIGTGFVAQRGQHERVEQFRELQAASAGEFTWSTAPPPEIAPGLPAPPEVPERAGVVGRLRIPAIGVDEVVAVGTEERELQYGPGLWEDGVMPGVPGNATIAGHRNTYGGPFYHLDKLSSGDRIVFETPGRPDAVFEVRASRIVNPHDVGVTAQGPGVRLTLTTCDPVGSDAKRLIVQAELIDGDYVSQALGGDEWEFRI